MRIKPNKLDRFSNGLGLLLLVGTGLYLLFSWPGIPDRIPSHFNVVGIPDRFADKSSLLSLIAINWTMFMGLSVVQRYPQYWNTGRKVTKKNRAKIFGILHDMLGLLKVTIVAIFSFLTINTSQSRNLPSGFLIGSLTFLFGVLGYYFYKLFRLQ